MESSQRQGTLDSCSTGLSSGCDSGPVHCSEGLGFRTVAALLSTLHIAGERGGGGGQSFLYLGLSPGTGESGFPVEGQEDATSQCPRYWGSEEAGEFELGQPHRL